MSNSMNFYGSLLDLNKESFMQKMFMVAYHSLSGALYCAFHLQDKNKVLEVHQLATEQLQHIQTQMDSKESANEPLEVTLYTSLTRIAHPRHMLGFHGHAPQF